MMNKVVSNNTMVINCPFCGLEFEAYSDPHKVSYCPHCSSGSCVIESKQSVEAKQSVFNKQIGGQHYMDMPIQPVEYILRNGLGFCEGAVVKYVSRWRAKNGIEDLKKAIHMIELLIEMEEG